MDDDRRKKLEEKRREVEEQMVRHRRLVDDVLEGKTVLCLTCQQPLTFTGSRITCPNGCLTIQLNIKPLDPRSRD